MNAGEDSHWHVTRIVNNEHLIDFQNRAEFAIECFGWNVRQVEIYLVLTVYASALNANLKDFARGNVTRNEVTVRRVGRGVLLEPIGSPFDTAAWFGKLDEYLDEPFMPEGRQQPALPPPRKIFGE